MCTRCFCTLLSRCHFIYSLLCLSHINPYLKLHFQWSHYSISAVTKLAGSRFACLMYSLKAPRRVTFVKALRHQPSREKPREENTCPQAGPTRARACLQAFFSAIFECNRKRRNHAVMHSFYFLLSLHTFIYAECVLFICSFFSPSLTLFHFTRDAIAVILNKWTKDNPLELYI